MNDTSGIVQKLWNFCHVLRGDGVTYHQYVTELTLLLFLKMAKERHIEDEKSGKARIPVGYRWDDLKQRSGLDQLNFYRRLLIELGTADNGLVRAIYSGAGTAIREPVNLGELVSRLDDIHWYEAKTDGLGDLYEGLLEKNAAEVKSGAGQYFTPRPLIDSIVAVMQPRAGEVIQDPAAGTAGFLIAADRCIRQATDDLYDLTIEQRAFQRSQAFVGVELVADTRRLALMNCLLHDIEGPAEAGGAIRLGDTLTSFGVTLPKADVILTNPPFGTKSGGQKVTRDDFTYVTSNKQLAFVEHVYRALKPGGRAAVVVPDNVLFEGNVGQQIRRDLMDKCNLHTILRLPTGIFYAQGVKMNVLFFTRGKTDKGNTANVWVYDLRANTPQFGKRTPLTRAVFEPFERAYGDEAAPSAKALAKRGDEGETGRFRRFGRDEIAARGDSLDISWLKDDAETADGALPEPGVLAREAMSELEGALDELRAILAELGEDEPEVEV